MVVDERTRHGLYTRLEDVLGSEHAMTLMEHLPPVGWADVATKQDLTLLKGDLVGLEERMGLRMEALKYELQTGFHVELLAQTRMFLLITMGSMATIATLAFAAARLT